MADPSQDHLILTLTIGTIGVLVLAVFIILFFFTYQKRMHKTQQEKQKREIEFQQQMSYAQLETQEKERIRIASDLHDSLGSLLWGAKLNATFIERSVSMQEEAKESHVELMASLDESIQVIRRIAWELTPKAFQHMGLSESLSSLCKHLNGKQMIVSFHQEGDYLWCDDSALQVYRIVQELVSNCLKHSKASHLHIHLHWEKDQLILSAEDNGIGFSLADNRRGVGWWNIEQRAVRLKAKITIGKTPYNSGSSVVLNIPLVHDK